MQIKQVAGNLNTMNNHFIYGAIISFDIGGITDEPQTDVLLLYCNIYHTLVSYWR